MNSLKFNLTTVSMDIGGTPISLETGRIAKQASGSVIVRQGDTMVMVAVCCAEAREGLDYFPLTVDYREPVFAAGKIPGGWFKREGKATTKETLVSRLIDRPLRPLFEEGYNGDTTVTAQVISFDGQHQPDVLAIVGASAALLISEIPFRVGVAGVRVGRINGEFVVNPTVSQRAASDLDLVVAGTEEAIVMVEAGAHEVQESAMVDALLFGHDQIKKLVKLQKDLQAKVGKTKLSVTAPQRNREVYDKVVAQYATRLMEALTMKVKIDSYKTIDALKKEAVNALSGEDNGQSEEVKACFDLLKETLFRNAVLKQGIRLDGRKFDQIRPLNIEVGLLPSAHGSALFTRGETQALVTTTLGTSDDIQIIDGLEEEIQRKFYLHYNFPGYSVGECKPNRGPGRREIGHGALAERAIAVMMPEASKNPYTVRVVSEITESNGSSSMATICGGTLALMDAGIQLKHPVAGVAMGLVSEGDNYVILTDIAGQEDHYGDMDFKVAGTRNGITALQMDIKIAGIDENILKTALEQAQEGRMFILKKMEESIKKPSAQLSKYAPKIITFNINPDKIREVIGTGGKVINKIIDDCDGVKIDISDEGRVCIGGENQAMLDKARKIVEGICFEPAVGYETTGKVVRIIPIGAFVEFNGKDGMIHISKLSKARVEKVEDVVKIGDEVHVKVIKIDEKGRIDLQRIEK